MKFTKKTLPGNLLPENVLYIIYRLFIRLLLRHYNCRYYISKRSRTNPKKCKEKTYNPDDRRIHIQILAQPAAHAADHPVTSGTFQFLIIVIHNFFPAFFFMLIEININTSH